MGKNREVAQLLYQIGEILELQGVAFKPRAYQRAAQNVEALGEDIEAVAREGRLGEIPGVGEAIQEKVTEFLTTGRLAYLDKLKKEVPAGVLQILGLPGVGPKTTLRLWKELKIETLDQLKKACQERRLQQVKGFGLKTEEEILRAIERASRTPARFPVTIAIEVARELEQHIRQSGATGRIVFAGSYRRGRDTLGDLDMLVEAPTSKTAKVTSAFLDYGRVKDTLEKGDTRSRVLLSNGLQVDLRVIPNESFGAAMQYFTGSKEHNIAVRTLAVKMGLTMNEYAVSRKKDGRRIAGATEEEVYKAIGLPLIPPELRENRGEIELAQKGKLPELVELKDLRGDAHTHTSESDGFGSAEDMLAAAVRRGYDWYGVSDHTAGLGVARGLNGARFRQQRKALEKLQGKYPKLRIFQGAEINIRKDGTLDLDSKVRSELDYLVGSVHSAFKLEEKAQTQRVLDAMDAGIDILGHPTGRLLGERDSIEINLDRVAEKAKDRGVPLEINASPFRLDLWGDAIKSARDAGAKFILNSDAHTLEGLDAMPFGIVQARRGWLIRSDVVNAQPTRIFERLIGHAKGR